MNGHRWYIMPNLFEYRDIELYCHHSIDEHPMQENFPMHTHDMMEIFYFLSGSGQYLVEGNSYPLEPHYLLIISPA